MVTLYSIGHSNKSLADFLSLLRINGIRALTDIRQFTRSRANPQFNAETFPLALGENGIAYEHIKKLGGRRSSRLGDSPNALWENEAFRSYADYALGDEFERGLAELLRFAQHGPAAMMCAEAVWWRCHRRIVTDYLLARGHHVLHILSEAEPKPGTLTPGAVIHDDGKITYPPKQAQLL
ncbi:MAG TPA: DUF488 domain-containing protein [Rhizomicrobium sp.]|nr:DUF488 domain-containing protein [Rhizomicrobium sp.]